MRWLTSVPRDRMGHSNSERQMVAGPVLGMEATVPLGTPFSSRIAGLFYMVMVPRGHKWVVPGSLRGLVPELEEQSVTLVTLYYLEEAQTGPGAVREGNLDSWVGSQLDREPGLQPFLEHTSQ